MNFLDVNGSIKKYNCAINGISLSSISELSCDTSNNPISTTVSKLHLSTGSSSDGSLLTLEMIGYYSNSTFAVEITQENYIPPAAEEYDNSTASNEAETGNATSKDATVNASKPVSQKGYESDKKDASVQVMKFYSFKAEDTKIIFGSFFYFIGRRIPYSIIMRLRITYSSRLRSLQTGDADSVRTDCVIGDEDLAGDTATGNNVRYSCEANTSKNAANAKVQLNTDFDLVLADKQGRTESLSFDKISFNGNTTEEAQNIQSSTEIIDEAYTLKETIAYMDKYTLILSGRLEQSKRLLRTLALSEDKEIGMNLKTKENGEDITVPYECTIEHISSPPTLLKCDTSDNPIITNAEKLHLSAGKTSDNILLSVEMDGWNGNTTEISPTESGSNYIYAKSSSSSGLSAGAIVAIVIPCVAVLLAAIIIAAVLRKPPAPPVANTTIFDLKNSQ